MSVRLSGKVAAFPDSVIRNMTMRNLRLHGPARAVNFAQGFPDFEPPPEIVAAAQAALDRGGDYHQYAITWGAPTLRDAIAAYQSRVWDRPVDAENEISVVCGATEGMLAALFTTVEPGDEVIVFEPFYECYVPDTLLVGARPRYVQLRPPDWRFDPDELRSAFTARTKAIIVNTPHNPTGKVFSRAELQLIAELDQERGVTPITDEIYEHLVYEGEHVSLATLPGMAERTITISGASKTYSVTGWRIGWLIAPPQLTAGIRKVHDYLTVGTAHPLQIAVAAGLRLPEAFYERYLNEYRERRDLLVAGLNARGFTVSSPAGAYYVMAGFSRLSQVDDVAFAEQLIETAGVATVPGSSFYAHPELGRKHVRFSFPKRLETIERGLEALAGIA